LVALEKLVVSIWEVLGVDDDCTLEQLEIGTS
jgi:hypothetical protein